MCARENLKELKKKKEDREKESKDEVEKLRARNFEFKKESESRLRAVHEALRAKKEAQCVEGRKLKEKVNRAKARAERKLRSKALATKKSKCVGKMWLEQQAEALAQQKAERLEEERREEVARLKKARRAQKKYLKKEESVLNNFQKDQEYQENVLEEFKNTINNN